MKTKMLLLLLLLSHFVFAQSVNVKWGKDIGGKSESFNVMGIDSVGDLIYASPTLLARIVKRLGKIDIYHTFSYLSKPNRTFGVVHTPHHNYATVTNYNEQTKKLEEYFIEIDGKGNPEVADRLVASNDFTEYKSRPNNSQYTQDLMGNYFSADEKLILHVSQNSVHDLNKSPEKLYFTLLDENLNVIWKKEQVFPFDDRVVDFNDVYLTNSGKVVLVGSYPKTLTTGILRKELPYSYELFEVSAESMRQTKINTGLEMQPQKFLFRELPGGDMMIAGVYFAPTKNYNDESAGIFTAKLNMSSFTISSRNTSPYDVSTADGEAKQKLNLKKSTPNPIFFTSSSAGEMALLLKAYVDGNSSSVFYDFVTLNMEGKVLAQKMIEKKFSTQTSYRGNYILDFGDKILLLGNEGRDGKQTFQATFFDYKGVVLSEKQLEMTNNKYYFVPRTALKVSDRAIVIGAAPYDANGYTPIHMYGAVIIN